MTKKVLFRTFLSFRIFLVFVRVVFVRKGTIQSDCFHMRNSEILSFLDRGFVKVYNDGEENVGDFPLQIEVMLPHILAFQNNPSANP